MIYISWVTVHTYCYYAIFLNLQLSSVCEKNYKIDFKPSYCQETKALKKIWKENRSIYVNTTGEWILWSRISEALAGRVVLLGEKKKQMRTKFWWWYFLESVHLEDMNRWKKVGTGSLSCKFWEYIRGLGNCCSCKQHSIDLENRAVIAQVLWTWVTPVEYATISMYVDLPKRGKMWEHFDQDQDPAIILGLLAIWPQVMQSVIQHTIFHLLFCLPQT